ncbi:MAG TPA: hypothetical protein IAB07_02820 [Candidatus Caccalectryoclostridium excrementigallinarum]|uniref:Uncharacterized protein n=1 Tax=Candidatus Caccalectryoclostridium excrementigallinarum TaxID=2840710 RepID=A0A9D1MM50_9FIRM|nr:hypothetical protein [Candidatus Caccalectryoclostridium excrementigallinarum]
MQSHKHNATKTARSNRIREQIDTDESTAERQTRTTTAAKTEKPLSARPIEAFRGLFFRRFENVSRVTIFARF